LAFLDPQLQIRLTRNKAGDQRRVDFSDQRIELQAAQTVLQLINIQRRTKPAAQAWLKKSG
jgi:hypothetical protein